MMKNLAKSLQIKVEEREFSLEEAKAASEAFISSASNYIVPVTHIDGNVVGEGQPGPISRRLRDAYLDQI